MEDKMNCGPEKGCKCPDCERREAQMAKEEETNFAVLIALVPVMTFSFFNMLGLL